MSDSEMTVLSWIVGIKPDWQAEQLLATFDIRHRCDLDLLLFFVRHPRSLLHCERLASFMGHDPQQIAESLEVLVSAGLLTRTAHPSHAARLYVFGTDGPNSDALASLVELLSTREGQMSVRRAVAQRSAQRATDAEASRRRVTAKTMSMREFGRTRSDRE